MGRQMDKEGAWREPRAGRPGRSPEGEESNRFTGTRCRPNSTPWPSLYLGLHLQGWEGQRPLIPRGREGLGFPPPAVRGCPHPSPELISGCHLHGEVLVKEI